MNSVRLSLLIGLFLSAVPLLAGCGSEAPSQPAGAALAPASAQLFVSIDTSFDSSQWKTAGKVLTKFPDGDKAVEFLLKELGDQGIDFSRDVEPALGPETDIVGLDLSAAAEFVGLTQPDDAQKLEALFSKSDQPVVTREIEGWTAFAETDAILDRFEEARAEGSLADASDFNDAMGEVAGESLASLYVNGGAVQDAIERDENIPPGALATLFPGGKVPSFALSLRAEDGGVRFEGSAKLAGDERGIFPAQFKAELPNEVPGDVLLYLGFNDLQGSLSAIREFLAQVRPDFDRDLARVEHELGVSLEEDVFPLFAGESAVYVRKGLLLPEVTLVTHVDDEQAAIGTVDKLVDALWQYAPVGQAPRDTTIDGVEATEVPLSPPFSLYYAALDGHLVVTTARTGISALRETDGRLADDADFRSALEGADVPDETTGFGYANLREGIRYLLGFADAAGAQLPDEVRANLDPLQNFVFYGTKDGRLVRFDGFLAVD